MIFEKEISEVKIVVFIHGSCNLDLALIEHCLD
jgi:hypothetical protein